MLVAPILSFIVGLVSLALMLRFRPSWLPLDKPNARSLHQLPVPRAGGVAIVLGVIVGALISVRGEFAWLLTGLLVVVVSWYDDRHGAPVHIRFGAQFAAAAIFAWMELGSLSLPMMVLAVVGIAWLCNLYNFMDGADGMAAGMAVIGFGCYAIAAGMSGQQEMAALCACVAFAAMAFLIFNWPPARIFMGDAGSVSLGFLAATMGLYGWIHGAWDVWFPFLVFSLFIVDATVTLVRRACRGEKVWEAHREHAYQKLVRAGWSHRQLAISAWVLMAISGMSALFLNRSSEALPVFAALTAWVIAYVIVLILVERKWKRWTTQVSA